MGRSVLRHLCVLRVSKGLRKSYLYTHMSHAVGAISSRKDNQNQASQGGKRTEHGQNLMTESLLN